MRPHDIPAWDTKLTELADGIFAYTQATGAFCIANAGYVAAGDEGVAIDALFSPRMTHAFQDALANVAPAPVRSLINTHHHVDHTLGNALFPEATIYAQAKAREHIALNGFPRERLVGMAPWFDAELPADIPIRLPHVTFDAHLTLHAGRHRLELIHAGHAHTVGDILVHLPEDRILFAGDVCFFYVTPLAFEGNIAGWVAALKAIEEMGEVDTIVPGHGPIGDKERVRELRTYFDVITEEARKRFDAGMDEDVAAREIPLGPYSAWGESERLVPNVYRLYSQFRGDPGGPIDVVRAFAGMAELSTRA
jgi:cyclase